MPKSVNIFSVFCFTMKRANSFSSTVPDETRRDKHNHRMETNCRPHPITQFKILNHMNCKSGVSVQFMSVQFRTRRKIKIELFEKNHFVWKQNIASQPWAVSSNTFAKSLYSFAVYCIAWSCPLWLYSFSNAWNSKNIRLTICNIYSLGKYWDAESNRLHRNSS